MSFSIHPFIIRNFTPDQNIKSQSNPPSVGGPTMAFPVIITNQKTHFRQLQLNAPPSLVYSQSLLCYVSMTLHSFLNLIKASFYSRHTHIIQEQGWCVQSDDQSLYIYSLFVLYTYNGVTYCLYILFLAYTLMLILLLYQPKLLSFFSCLFIFCCQCVFLRERERTRERQRDGEEQLEIFLQGFGSCGADNL